MHRHATIADLKFIYDLIIDGSKNGHYDRRFSEMPEAANGLQVNLTSILTQKIRHDGQIAYGIIYEYQNKPVGFVIMAAVKNNKGNEIWMASIHPDFRKQGFGKKMITGIFDQFKGKNLILMARCAQESKVMYQMLLKNGFKHYDTGKEGYRVLSYEL